MYVINVYDPSQWDLKLDATFYPTLPKKHQSLKKWCEDNKADITSNLCLFNGASAPAASRYYTIQYMNIPRLGGDCGYGGNSTTDLLKLPNGDKTSGWSSKKKPAIKDGQLMHNPVNDKRPKCAVGITNKGWYFTLQSNGVTSTQAANYAITYIKKYYSQAITLMLWEDGGGSVGTYCAKANQLFAPLKEGADGRYVCSVFCATLKPEATRISRDLKKGCKGDDVKLLQMMIGGVEADGSYGNATVNQVKKVQKALKLKVDGMAGPATQTALGIRAK